MTVHNDPASGDSFATWSRRGALRALGLGATATFVAGCGPSTAPSGASDTPVGGRTPAAPPTPAQAGSTAGQPRPEPADAEVTAAAGVPGRVALTFHGEGAAALAAALLGEAERAGARLTVLAVGRWLDQFPEMARRVLDGGHELGNHTQHHIDISALSAADAFAEIDECAARLRKLTGSAGRWFRPSQAKHATPTVLAQAERVGYPTVLSYDLDSLDYTDPGAGSVVHNVLSAVRGGDVVSMHLGHQGTVEALPAILDGLHARGLAAVTASELFSSSKAVAP